jgi:hypothetical protein
VSAPRSRIAPCSIRPSILFALYARQASRPVAESPRPGGLSAEGGLMATTPNPAPLEEELPWTHEVDQADQKLGSFLSDLDLIASSVKRFEGDPISLEEHARLVREGSNHPSGSFASTWRRSPVCSCSLTSSAVTPSG